MKFSLSKLLSGFFRLFLIFAVIFIWVRYYFSSLEHSAILSALIALFVNLFLHIISKKRSQKLHIKKEEEQLMEDSINTLTFKSQDYCVKFFYDMLKQNHTVEKKKYFALVKTTLSENKEEKVIIYPSFSFQQLSPDDLAQILRHCKTIRPNKIIICTTKASAETKSLVQMQNQKILLLEKEEVFIKFLKAYNFFPKQEDMIILQKASINKWKNFVSYALSAKRTKAYFISAIALLFSSFFVPYNLYYISFASLMLVLCLVTFTKPLFKKKLRD